MQKQVKLRTEDFLFNYGRKYRPREFTRDKGNASNSVVIAAQNVFLSVRTTGKIEMYLPFTTALHFRLNCLSQKIQLT